MLRAVLLGLTPAESVLRQALTGTSRLPSLLSSAQGAHQQQQSYATEATPGNAAHSTTQTDSPANQHTGDADLQVQDQQADGQLQQKQKQQQQQLPEVQQRLPGPILPTHIVLKALLDWEGELPTKADLWHKISQDYPDLFRSSTQFKQYLRNVIKKKWVAAKPPKSEAALKAQQAMLPDAAAREAAPAGTKQLSKKGKGAAQESYVYFATREGRKVPISSAGTPQQLAARRLADNWTAQHLPAYSQALQSGRIPVTQDNIHLLGAQQGMQRFQEQQQQRRAAQLHWQERQERRQQQQQQQQAPGAQRQGRAS